MTYVLQALIAREEILRVIADPNSLMQVVRLTQTIGMIPITEAFQEALDPKGKTGFHEENPFYGLSNRVRKFALNASLAGYVAYVEAEFFGGIGYQSAILWEKGSIALGPFLAQNLPLREMPINRVLREMGVQTIGEMDEFDTLGLGQHRRTDNWLMT